MTSAAWSSGIILASGARGPWFNSRSSPLAYGFPMSPSQHAKMSSRNNVVIDDHLGKLNRDLQCMMKLWRSSNPRPYGADAHGLPAQLRRQALADCKAVHRSHWSLETESTSKTPSGPMPARRFKATCCFSLLRYEHFTTTCSNYQQGLRGTRSV